MKYYGLGMSVTALPATGYWVGAGHLGIAAVFVLLSAIGGYLYFTKPPVDMIQENGEGDSQ